MSRATSSASLDPAVAAAIETAVEAAVGRALAQASRNGAAASPLLTTRETCQRLRISPATLYAWINAGRIKPASRLGNRNLFNAADVEALLNGGAA